MLKKPKSLSRSQPKQEGLWEKWFLFRGWIIQNRNYIIYGGLAILILGVAVTAVLWSKAATREEAALEELLARDAYSRGDLDSALNRAESIIERYEGSYSAAVAWAIKGKVYEARGFFDQARKAFERIIKDYSDYEYLAFGAYYSLGMIAFGEGEFTKSAQLFEQAVKKYPRHFYAAYALAKAGEAMERAQLNDQAKEFYRRVIRNYPKSRVVSKVRESYTRLEFVQ